MVMYMVLPERSGRAFWSMPTRQTAAGRPARQRTGQVSRSGGAMPRSANRRLRLRLPRLPGRVRRSSRRQGRTVQGPDRSASASGAGASERVIRQGPARLSPGRSAASFSGAGASERVRAPSRQTADAPQGPFSFLLRKRGFWPRRPRRPAPGGQWGYSYPPHT